MMYEPGDLGVCLPLIIRLLGVSESPFLICKVRRTVVILTPTA